jgi:hypothetical protein
MDLIMGDSLRHAVQIGTVATHPEYTRQGLAKKLLLHVVEQCAQSDLTFLYANDSVMSFYPRFGFELRAEHSYQVELKAQIVRSFPTFQKWIPHVEERELLSRRFQSRTPISTTLGISDYASLATWHCLILYKEQLWISDDAEILMVCRLTGDTLQIYDIVAERLDEDFFRKLQWPGATRAVIHFVPDRFTGEFVPVLDNSDAFFIRGKLESEKGKIPLLAHT